MHVTSDIYTGRQRGKGCANINVANVAVAGNSDRKETKVGKEEQRELYNRERKLYERECFLFWICFENETRIKEIGEQRN